MQDVRVRDGLFLGHSTVLAVLGFWMLTISPFYPGCYQRVISRGGLSSSRGPRRWEQRANLHDRLDTHEHENPRLSRRGFSYQIDPPTVIDLLPRVVSPADAGLGGPPAASSGSSKASERHQKRRNSSFRRVALREKPEQRDGNGIAG